MTRLLPSGLLLLCLTLCATGCGEKKVVVATRAVETPKPLHLLIATPVPTCDGCTTNDDLFEHVQDLYEALDACNKDKTEMRKAFEAKVFDSFKAAQEKGQ